MDRRSFYYELPADRIATIPVTPRDSARLLVCSRQDEAFVAHARVRDLGSFLSAGDLLVVNETRVLPHRLLGRRASGGRVECLILRRSGTSCEGFLRPSARLRKGEVLRMEGGELLLRVAEDLGSGRHRFELEPRSGGDPGRCLERVGRAPLPPYLRREPEGEDVALDRRRYQTVFARRPGAVAAPTAGLHLTRDLLQGLESSGISLSSVTLHVGEGTFEPIRADEIEAHRMHEEWFELESPAALAVNRTRVEGGRIFCVGTTSARVLETCFDPRSGRVEAATGTTRLFLYPGKGPRLLDGLLTNFHLPESTLLLLVASILGRERTLELYQCAIREGYRFYSYGDAMLILP
ncbi:MAG: tRNA preQ1(34) S-adenosylmethionine ribosyltransferase-isomerase QueA [Planctomycetota bacterium]